MPVCTPWIDGTEVAECCEVEGASDPTIFDAVAELASELLYQYSLRLFPGICERTVRPCATGCGCPWQILSRGHIVWNPNFLDPLYGWGYGWWSCNGDVCGCRPLSRTLLAGYVQEIVEVLIDGAVVDPATYRVDRNRWLVRVRENADDETWEHWPGCQNMDLPETEPGTLAVTYTYGRDVPESGKFAAKQLACQLYKQCVSEACSLPQDTVRVLRQGLVVEKPAFIGWAFEKGGRSIPRGWKTNIPGVDAFLNAYNPTGLVRLPMFWSPTRELQFAQAVGLPTAT
jgi:hypothetical protein